MKTHMRHIHAAYFKLLIQEEKEKKNLKTPIMILNSS